MCKVRYPLKAKLRAYYGKRLLTSLSWCVLWLAAWTAAVSFFYGPGEALVERAAYLIGGLSAVGLVGLLVSFGYLLARLVGFFCFTGGLRRSMRQYLPEGTDLRDPYGPLGEDIRCRLFERADIYLGSEWILFGGRAMRRDDVAGIFYNDLSQRFLSKKSRIQLWDLQGRAIEITLSPKQSPDICYNYLLRMHPRTVCGDSAAREGVGAISAYRLSRKVLQDAPDAPLGFSRWDKSPVLEENPVRWDYERWLLASYCLYIAGDPYYCGDFSRVGGYERTVRQRDTAREVLESPWEIRDREELLSTAAHLIETGRLRRSGWQLGRAPMVLAFGYLAEMITYAELMRYSLDAALAIQQTFSGWEELLDSYMESFAAWARDPRAVAYRRHLYQEMRRDPRSLLHTIPFQADLPALYREACG